MTYKNKDDIRAKEASRRYYEKHKDEYYARNKLKRARIRAWMAIYKESHPCLDCKLYYPNFVMDFDHRDPATKVRDPNRLASRLSWKKMHEEIAKCDLVCSNCHRFRTHTTKGVDAKQVQSNISVSSK
jgi:hypothetical protein